ncbi:MAG TPA: retropepsin-like aspartic protease [Candidatus Dormibacteraeota bacterium]|nr:retropepsin-like aspartic protease [Candidatus Dormibacteraeota bacterium]
MARVGLAACLAAAWLPPGAAGDPLPGAPANRTFPVSLARGGRILVDARINGQPVQALLDSAAEMSFVDRALAARLRLRTNETVAGQGSGRSSFEAGLIKGVQLEVFGVALRDQTVATASLQDVGQRLLGRGLDLILGREIFDAARLRIDIEGRTVAVLDRSGTPPGIQLGLIEEYGVETIPARAEGAPVRATFDLGNGSGILVSARLADRLHLLTDGRPVRQSRGGGLGGETLRKVFTLRSLEVAGQTFHDVAAAVDEQPSASELNVGISVLRHFIVTSDFAAHAVWLEPRPAAGR